jgi:hypothetical protein
VLTHCFDKERRIPGEEEDYVLSGLRAPKVKCGMSQEEVWMLTCEEGQDRPQG